MEMKKETIRTNDRFQCDAACGNSYLVDIEMVVHLELARLELVLLAVSELLLVAMSVVAVVDAADCIWPPVIHHTVDIDLAQQIVLAEAVEMVAAVLADHMAAVVQQNIAEWLLDL